jgi:hypothetical protein
LNLNTNSLNIFFTTNTARMMFSQALHGCQAFGITNIHQGLHCSRAAQKNTFTLAYHKNQPNGYTQEYKSPYDNTTTTLLATEASLAAGEVGGVGSGC